MAKFIVVGLGNFGTALSTKLTELGHEVLGVDNDQNKVDNLKDQITSTIQLDATDRHALETLPYQESDVVIVAIGEDFGASVLVTAIIKQLNVRRLIGRGISPLHRTVLEALEVDEIVMPEEDSAERLARSLDMKGVQDSLKLSENYSIIEVEVPEMYVGKTIQAVDFRSRFNINVITIKRFVAERGVFGVHEKPNIMGVISPDTKLRKKDVLVLFGTTKDIERLLGRGGSR
jgi:trk system potassium uptake protein TrkA